VFQNRLKLFTGPSFIFYRFVWLTSLEMLVPTAVLSSTEHSYVKCSLLFQVMSICQPSFFVTVMLCFL
jgi:hypothetical protein